MLETPNWFVVLTAKSQHRDPVAVSAELGRSPSGTRPGRSHRDYVYTPIRLPETGRLWRQLRGREYSCMSAWLDRLRPVCCQCVGRRASLQNHNLVRSIWPEVRDDFSLDILIVENENLVVHSTRSDTEDL